MKGDDVILERLRAEHPGWRYWRAVRDNGRPGSWMATLVDRSVGVDKTLVEPTARELRAQVERQQELAERGVRPPKLAATPYDGDAFGPR